MVVSLQMLLRCLYRADALEGLNFWAQLEKLVIDKTEFLNKALLIIRS